MNITLNDIFIGKANGLEEANDSKFQDLFYTGNQKYQQLLENHDKFIISGRKGTGKTILAKYYEKEMCKAGNMTKMLTTREIVLKLFLEKGSQDLERRETELFVEYVILTEMAKILLNNRKNFIRFKNVTKGVRIFKAIRELENLVEKRFEGNNYTVSNYSNSYQEAYSSSGHLGDDTIGIEANGNVTEGWEKNYVKSPYYQLIEKIKKNVFFLLHYVSASLIFDDLDEFDDRIDGNRNFIRFLTVFIETAHQINVQLRDEEIKDCRVIILLRSDIIKILNSETANLNKTMADCEIRLNWIKKVGRGEMHPLMDLLVTKIKKSNEQIKNLDNDKVVKMFFPETVNGVPIMDHMLNCSFGRPRDIINMLNIIRENYPEATSFKAEYFRGTQLEYSIKFIDELRNEMASYFEPLKTEECFNIIKRIGKDTFWLSDVEQVFCENEGEWKFFKTAKELIDVAYEFGIIGNTWLKSNVQGPKAKYNFSWKYREDGFDNPDYQKKFYLHLALRKSLLR